MLAEDNSYSLSIIRQELSAPGGITVTHCKDLGRIQGNFTNYDDGNLIKIGDYYYAMYGRYLLVIRELLDGSFSLASAPENLLLLPQVCSEIVAHRNLLFIKGLNTMEIVDITNPAAPVWVQSILFQTSSPVVLEDASFAFSGHNLLVSDSHHLAVYDVANISSPALVHTIAYESAGISTVSYEYCTDILVSNSLAYIEIVDPGWDNRLIKVDLSAPESPAITGYSEEYRLGSQTSAEFNKIRIFGNYCFVLDSGSNFSLIDIQDPGSPHYVSTRSFNNVYLLSPYRSFMEFDTKRFICIDRDMDVLYAE